MLPKDHWHLLSYKDRVTNEHVRKTIIKHIGPYEDLATVKQRKLKWYGHVTRSDGLTKVILQGTFEGSRRRGRPKKSWIDNIAEWTGKSFAETHAMAHHRKECIELMRKSVMTRPYGSLRSKGPRQGRETWRSCTIIFLMTRGNSERLGRSGNETPENKRNSEKQTRMSPGAGRDSKVQGDKSGDLGHKLN